MSKLFSKPLSLGAQTLLLVLLAAGGASAGDDTDVLNARIKASLNTMVQDVHAAPTPVEKRAVLDQFLARAERATGLAEKLPFLSEENRAALHVLQGKFDRYSLEFHGAPGSGSGNAGAGVPNGSLDAFASYMQNDLEQANGGIYLSTGAIIIVLLIILILL